MNPRQAAVAVAVTGACVGAGFLAYTLNHLERLGITTGHPRVLVEAAVTLGCAAALLQLLT